MFIALISRCLIIVVAALKLEKSGHMVQISSSKEQLPLLSSS